MFAGKIELLSGEGWEAGRGSELGNLQGLLTAACTMPDATANWQILKLAHAVCT